jgi:tRNA threonylcarbamoyladenosine biosynthesis protein TsaE
MFEIGFEEYLDSSAIVVIEWAELIDELIPADHIWVEIKKDIDEHLDKRIITVQFTDERELQGNWRMI